ncbi:hypothetical protein FOZ60_000170 [Perkinsus olseni]|uniref:RIIa domain-containing protein n=1 Tax=Perkinsus olseni TaxID=32597 RepID=A0A7J6PLN7_PEROL|nr:hypothetical protein FOZ60_000170 [Perkinsus olseni]
MKDSAAAALESLNCEQRQVFQDREEELREGHEEFLRSHPELRQILNDFIAATLLHQPEDIFEFAKNYFLSFKTPTDTTKGGVATDEGSSA